VAPQTEAAPWLAENVLGSAFGLLIVAVAERVPPVLGAAWSVTEPFPEPEAPAETVSQEAFDTADHGQPSGAVTFTEILPPAASKILLAGLMSIVHAPRWKT